MPVPLHSPENQQAIADSLARMLTKFLPDIDQRVTVLESAVHALSDGHLSSEQRALAHTTAHKLAGTLGMFGLHRGTELAREAELMLAGEDPIADPAPLIARVSELRILLDETRKGQTPSSA